LTTGPSRPPNTGWRSPPQGTLAAKTNLPVLRPEKEGLEDRKSGFFRAVSGRNLGAGLRRKLFRRLGGNVKPSAKRPAGPLTKNLFSCRKIGCGAAGGKKCSVFPTKRFRGRSRRLGAKGSAPPPVQKQKKKKRASPPVPANPAGKVPSPQERKSDFPPRAPRALGGPFFFVFSKTITPGGSSCSAKIAGFDLGGLFQRCFPSPKRVGPRLLRFGTKKGTKGVAWGGECPRSPPGKFCCFEAKKLFSPPGHLFCCGPAFFVR